MSFKILRPTLSELDSYADALRRGWSPDNVRGKMAADEQLEKIAQDPAAFVLTLDDREARGGPIKLPNGGTVQRLPGFVSWMWDGEFCGSIGLRWQKGTSELPPWMLGHIGYSVVPWKRGRGYATEALRLLLPHARAQGLAYVELTTDPDNIPSQKVITSNGGYSLGRFTKDAMWGGGESIRWRIDL